MTTTQGSTATIHLDICTPEGRTWLAQVRGFGNAYPGGVDRRFVRAAEWDTSRSGKTGRATYLVDDGVYEANEGRRRLGRSWIVVEGGEARTVTRDEAITHLTAGAR